MLKVTRVLLFFLFVFFVQTDAFAQKVFHENGLYIVKIKLSANKIEPYVADKLETVYEIAQKTQAKVAINTGFFDGKNAKTVSYIRKNGIVLANPSLNENLTSNADLKPYLQKIYNRSELRILNCEGKIKADIVSHFSEVPNNCTILNSTQAGPRIYPEMNLEKEFFVTKKDGKIIRDSIGVFKRTDRSLVAIKGNFLYFIITDEQTRLTIPELAEKLKKYKFEKVLNLDGGGSVSLFVRNKDGIFYQAREKNNTSRAIKSALIVY